MNIHLDYNDFKNSNYELDMLGSATFGSTMYGTNNKNSDEDVIIIMKNIKRLPIITHHQIQLKRKDNNIHKQDIIISTLDQFLHNLLNGDSTINYEVVMQNCFKNTTIDFLHDFKKMFTNYNIINSYYGMAKRDIKFYKKSNDINDKKKKLNHIIRGVLIGNFIKENYKIINEKTTLNNIFSIILQITNHVNISTEISYLDIILDKYEKIMIDNKKALFEMLNNNEIQKVYMFYITFKHFYFKI